jgi:hypothetical protein
MIPISRPKNVLLSARWKMPLRAAAVLRRPVEQARAVRSEDVSADDVDVRRRLLGAQQVRDDRVDHRQEPVSGFRSSGRAGGAGTRRCPPS